MNLWLTRLQAVRCRLFLATAMRDGLALAAGATGLWALATLLLRRVSGNPPPLPWPWGLGASLLAAAFLLGVGRRNRWSLRSAAEAADRLLGSRDLMATALWLSQQEPAPPSGAVVLQQAQAAAHRLDPHRIGGLPGPGVVLPRLAAFLAAAALGIWANVAPLHAIVPPAPPPAPVTARPDGEAPPEEASLDTEEPGSLSQRIHQLGEALAQGGTTPQSARETLDRLLRGLEETGPSSGPRSRLSPVEQEELEALLEQIIGRAGDPAGSDGGRPKNGPEGGPGDLRPSDGGASGPERPGSGPGAPSLDPGLDAGAPGSERGGPQGPGEGGRPSTPGEAPLPAEEGPWGEEAPGGGRREEGPGGSGALPGIHPGEPSREPGSLPPPAPTSGEADLLPATPQPGPYGLTEGPPVAPLPGLHPTGRLPQESGPAPEADPRERPVTQPLLPALYREWIERYFTPDPS